MSVSRVEYLVANAILEIDKQCKEKGLHVDQLRYPISAELNPSTHSTDPLAGSTEIVMEINYAVFDKALV